MHDLQNDKVPECVEEKCFMVFLSSPEGLKFLFCALYPELKLWAIIKEKHVLPIILLHVTIRQRHHSMYFQLPLAKLREHFAFVTHSFLIKSNVLLGYSLRISRQSPCLISAVTVLTSANYRLLAYALKLFYMLVFNFLKLASNGWEQFSI